ncbi:MAG: helix-turn-helix domain-containing protein [Armatimonadetes bacterium]|nr:helix-turn-helix domain-containing protein [Akkermansiaceae bacterium]
MEFALEESLGNKLRLAREAAGISVNDAVYLARMPRAVVEALEADDFGFFSSPLYARSFLKQYSDYVGLDVERWLEDFVPTALIDSDTAESFIEISTPAHLPIAPKIKRGSGGGLAALWIVLISGGMVWLGIKLVERFDFALAEKPVTKTPQAPPLPAEPEPTQPRPEEKPKPISRINPEPPPRAVVVEITAE